MTIGALRAFYLEFRGDEALSRLFGTKDVSEFTRSLVALGMEKGFEFSESDVTAALADPGFFLKEALGEEELTDAELAVMAGGATATEHTTVVGGMSGTAVAGRKTEQWETEFQNVATHVKGTTGGSSGGGTSSKP